ncbi:NAD(P)/FAD-dependent oxidoreductase [Homoserinimonas sp. OAct 916]|uniref:flavin-containing monooxygenase n=1 Tax=Homoserinimonas sp. OAct 916 TaxID=2211450 RepID=UPI000DBE5832|nr:NAD(P)-binding domain-containing protein [Homoserinimonas sp. OAct 916]
MSVDTIVIGAGQAGLATGHHLAKQGISFEILEAGQRIGQSWRDRWKSLRLFTPVQYSALPGMSHSNSHSDKGYLRKDEFADYLEEYASQFELPVRLGVRVERLTRTADGFEVVTSAGSINAHNVVLATGPNALPHIPAFAATIDPSITQLHSSEYVDPASIPDGNVLVVGAGTSGAEIALELAATHRVTLAGRPTAHIPDPVFTYAGAAYWAFISSVLTVKTPIGRRVAKAFHASGAPLIRISMKQVESAGVSRKPRLMGAADAESSAPTTIIWATGFTPDLSWLPDLPLGPGGYPTSVRGEVTDVPGLFLVGMPFQFGLTSGLIGGVGRDAEWIVKRIAHTRHAERSTVNTL